MPATSIHGTFTHPEGYRLRIVGIPVGQGTKLMFYFDHLDRPVFEHVVSEKFRLGHVAMYSVCGGADHRINVATFRDWRIESLSDDVSSFQPSAQDIVLNELNLNYPPLVTVRAAIRAGNRNLAAKRLLKHLANRESPVGAKLREREYGNYLAVANAALENKYGTLGPHQNLSETYVDGAGNRQRFVDPDGTIRWDLCHGHLTRHFHWCSLAKAYKETNDPKYAERFSMEVQDWVKREPFLHPRNPDIGGLNWMDGTVFRNGYMNTSNIGRRCELTWWPAYEVFRKSPQFDADAHFHMLLGFIRQSRLIMNPSSFAAHDDGGAHTSVALLQNALMLPELKESKRWEQIALKRWDEVLRVQFHEDGSHVSLSTGYNWASIMALENMVAMYHRVGRDVPARFMKVLERAYEHPLALSRPDQGQIDMNDGGWGKIDDHMRRAVKLFPERQDFRWMATQGERGQPPQFESTYFPNAGHFVMRTGWGPQHRYLFMDAGPVGASHGKEDKLNIYVDLGGHQLLSSGGRGSYAGGPFTAYTGSTRGYNTLLVDDGVQSRIPPRFEIDGHRPEQRRWVTTEQFDFAEGTHSHGWFKPGRHIAGTHSRQILFIKGTDPPQTSYWVVFDTVQPTDDAWHDYSALFHIRRNHAGIASERDKIVNAWDDSASLRIVPVDTNELEVDLIRGQTQPHIQGWHVVGKSRAPMWTPVFRWRANRETTRAWVLVPAGKDQKWCVSKVQLESHDRTGLIFRCDLASGSSDLIYRRSQSTTTHYQTASGGKVAMVSDIGVISMDQDKNVIATFFAPEK